jgi:integrase
MSVATPDQPHGRLRVTKEATLSVRFCSDDCGTPYTGLRANEAKQLHADDVDLPNRLIHLVERSGSRFKTEKSAQPVPIPEELAVILEAWLYRRMDSPEAGFPRPPECPYLFPNVTRRGCWTGGPIGHKPGDQVKAVGQRAGVKGFTLLSLRHSYATHSESWGLSPMMVQRVLRHTSLQTQMHYRHADEANMKQATKGIGFGPSPTLNGEGEVTS